MIVLSGQRLVGVDYSIVSPLVQPIRSLVFLLPIVFFAIYAYQYLRKVHTGATLVVKSGNPFLAFSVLPGKLKLTTAQKKAGYVSAYSTPFSSMLLGVVFLFGTVFLSVLLFLQPEYFFVPNR